MRVGETAIDQRLERREIAIDDALDIAEVAEKGDGIASEGRDFDAQRQPGSRSRSGIRGALVTTGRSRSSGFRIRAGDRAVPRRKSAADRLSAVLNAS